MHYCIASSKKTTAQPNLAERRRTSRRGLHYTRRSTRAAAQQQRTTAQAPGRQLALWSSHAAPLPPSSHRVRLRRTRLSLSLSSPKPYAALLSLPVSPSRAGGGADEIPAMAGPTSRLLILARRADRRRCLPFLVPRALQAAPPTFSPALPLPPCLPASTPVMR